LIFPGCISEFRLTAACSHWYSGITNSTEEGKEKKNMACKPGQKSSACGTKKTAPKKKK
jgi:hypothetical protein